MIDIVLALMLLKPFAVATLALRFRTKNICCCRFAFAQKTSAAAASLSRKKHLLA